MAPGASSVASFGSQRKRADAAYRLKVVALEERRNVLQNGIWSAEEELIEAQEKLEEADAAAIASPFTWQLSDDAAECRKAVATAERNLRAVKRRNELGIRELDNKIACENAQHEADLAELELEEDQLLGILDPDKNEGQRENVHKSVEWLNQLQTTSPEVPRPPSPEEILNNKVLDLVNMQLQLMQQQQHQPSTSERFLIRQTTGKDLPQFGGDCSEWPAFHAQYVQTTTACGFSPVENLYRLQKALNGRAKEVVQAFLTTPDNVDTIMEILEQQFGKPRFIIMALVQKVKDAPAPKDGKPESLIKFSNVVKNLVITIQNLKKKEYLCNPQLIEELVQKLDGHYRIRWGEYAVDKDLDSPTLTNFSQWLDKLSRSAQVVAGPPAVVDEKKKSALTITADTQLTGALCLFCTKPNHKLVDCRKFQQKPVHVRANFVKEKRLCFSCLRGGHSITNCNSQKECGIDDCKSYHHQLLHKKKRDVNEDTGDGDGIPSLCTSCSATASDVLLRIAPITIEGPNGKLEAHALFDEGATCSLLDSDVAESLGITGKKKELTLQWTNDVSETHTDSEVVNFTISSSTKSTPVKLCNVRTVSNLQLPTQSMNVDELKKRYSHLRGLPVSCQKEVRPVLLLGEDNIHLTIARELKEGPVGTAPLASRTKLGWVIHGCCRVHKMKQFSFTISTKKNKVDEDLHELVKQSFKLEHYGTSLPKVPASVVDERASKLLESTSKKSGETRWETGLLWSKGNIHLPPSKEMALSRLSSVERKVEKDKDYRDWYVHQIEHYIAAGYCSEVSREELQLKTPKEFYLPHFAASNPNKPGKLRLVFDAAAKVNGTSLNDHLLTGPDLLNSLPGILMRFRRSIIGFGADVKEMFHQVNISSEDRKAQRFLWRGGDRTKEAKVFEMNVMMFGAACSPCSAQYVMRRNADEFVEVYPKAAASIHDSMYMDDLVDGADTPEDTKDLIASIDIIRTSGGFPMLKWMSNMEDVLEPIPQERRASAATKMDMKIEGSVERVLGMYWDPADDVLTFRMNFPKVNENIISGTSTPTKRDVLKLTMSLFDPLGLIANYVIRVRILLQQVWSSEIGWDELLPPSLLEKWNLWLSELKKVTDVRVKRCYSFLLKSGTVSLHVFCDASEMAYAAVAYILIQKGEEKEVAFVIGKARVAPLKPLSIPRLELLAAVMAVRLSTTIKKEIKINISNTTYWSDSRNVLCWIRSDARKYKQFVGLDEENILRVGSRLANAPILHWQKYPAILDGNEKYTQLLIMERHIQMGHGNHDAVINSIRQEFWIPRLRSSLKRVVNNCMQCRESKAVPLPPQMGNLPVCRFGINQPAFTHCGLDLFGPVSIMEGRKELKRYVVEIDASIKDLDFGALGDKAAQLGVDWKFIPPSAPHFGGCWERMVRCVKTALYAALKSLHIRRPREEVFETLLSEASNIVNSRPLTDVSPDPGAEEALTTNHFIKGQTGTRIFGTFFDDDYCLRKQWRIAQRLLDHFWKRWLEEYLPTLHSRKKRTKEQQPIKLGDYVYIADSNELRGEWTRAIVVHVYPGKDGIIRVVDLRTASGRVLKRPVAKCAIVSLEPEGGI